MRKNAIGIILAFVMILTPSGAYASVSINKANVALPREYNLMKEGLATNVKDQGDFGDCWAFGALASLESSLIRINAAQKNVDFSERHLAWFAYNGRNDASSSKYAGADTFLDINNEGPYEVGGGRDIAISTLARGYGPVKESTAAHDIKTMTGLDNSLQTLKNVKLKEAIQLPETVLWDKNDKVKGIDRGAIETIKKFVYKRGAISIGLFTDKFDDNYNDKTFGFYSGNEGKTADHEVTIVGWNDDFSRGNFATKTNTILPKNNGAWIIKNSWGESSFGDKGLFYVSYEDTSLATPTFYQGKLKTSDNENVYQYDGVGYGDGAIDSSNAYIAANTFTAESNEIIGGFGITLPYDKSKVTITLYKNVGSKSPTDGEKVFVQTVNKARGGYYTIPAKQKVKVDKDSKFTAKIKISYIDGGETYYVLPCETKFDKDSYVNIDRREGETHLYQNRKWVDVTQIEEKSLGDEGNYYIGNACIKVFSNKAS